MLYYVTQHKEGHIGKEGGELKKGEIIVSDRERTIGEGGETYKMYI
jgi:hypothetical protein